MDSWHTYPKVFALGHRYLQDLFNGPFQVEEKVDGSQFSFGVFGVDKVVRFRSKGVEINRADPPKMFWGAIEWVERNVDKLTLNYTYRAEWIPKPKANVLTYNRAPADGLVIFDISTGLESYMKWTHRAVEADRIGLEAVPIFLDVPDQGADPLTMDEFKALLKRHSFLGGSLVEGVVIKNYTQFGPDGHALFGKFVSEQFKEAHGKEKYRRVKAPAVASVIDYFKTEARWEKAVQHLREKGILLEEPRDIGSLIMEVKADFAAECQIHAGELLYQEFQRDLLKGITAGIAEWYKERLAGKQFQKETEVDFGPPVGKEVL